jgi:hypothetical protein
MWLMNYSRLIAHLLVLAVCGVIGIQAIRTGHRWTPAIIFVAYMLGCQITRRKLPPVTADPQHLQQMRSFAIFSHRFLGVFSAIGMSLFTVLLLLTRFKIGDVPRWATAIGLAVGWFWVWYHFPNGESCCEINLGYNRLRIRTHMRPAHRPRRLSHG